MHRRGFMLYCLTLPLLARAAVARPAAGSINVLYAGSLVNLMEHGIAPAFDRTGHGRFQGFAGGSNGLANQIKDRLRHADIFISATPSVNDDLMGGRNGNWVSWYITFAQSPVVIGYNPVSRFAAELKSKPWYKVLQQPGIRIGRTDPKLDPKGKLTIRLMDKAAQITGQPDLAQKVLGPPDNPQQVFPEETLIGQLQSGQLDVGFFYSTETAELKIPAIQLPPEVTLSAHYTMTIVRGAADPAGAQAFVAFLLGPDGRRIMRAHGLDVLTPALQGDAAQAPAAIRRIASAT
jgi:molybdate/tungstate transport system substrate-binding protein